MISGVNKELRDKKYFHGLIPREDVPDLLKRKGQFLLRVTEPAVGMPQSVVISVRIKDKENDKKEAAKYIKHFVVRQYEKTGEFHCEKKRYKTIPLLVDAYLKGKLTLDQDETVTITEPKCREEWELEADQVEVGKKLGEGAYGAVCLGKALGKEVAIKQNHMTKLDKVQIKEVMAEARTIRRLKHPNIINFVGISALEEPLMIIMELANQGCLDSYMQTHGAMMGEQKAAMCQELANALVFLKHKNMLHRDLALRNCLLHNHKVLLSDFGKAQPGPEYRMDPTEKLPIRWLSPETMSTLKFSFASEVWSFGIVCWEVYANGQEPYPGLMVRQVNEQVVAGHRMQMPAETPKNMKALIEQKIWAFEGARLSIEQVLKSLEQITGKSLEQAMSSKGRDHGNSKSRSRSKKHKRDSSESSSRSKKHVHKSKKEKKTKNSSKRKH